MDRDNRTSGRYRSRGRGNGDEEESSQRRRSTLNRDELAEYRSRRSSSSSSRNRSNSQDEQPSGRSRRRSVARSDNPATSGRIAAIASDLDLDPDDTGQMPGGKSKASDYAAGTYRARSNDKSSGSRSEGYRVRGGASNSSTNDYSRDAALARYVKKGRHATSGSTKPIGKIVVGCIIAVLLVCGIAGAAWYFKIVGNISSDEDITVTAEVAGEPYYVLILGGDDRGDEATADDEGNRTDSIMVARIDEQEQTVHLISIPRDLRVNIPGHGYYKINAAIEFGGYDMTRQLVEEILGVKISYYAFVYFDGFETLVDKLDGVTVEVPEGTYYAGVSVPAGDAVTINGEEALVLARCRHGNPPDQGAYASGDYQRTLNQRNLIKAIAKRILEKDITEYPALIEGLSECVETNMSVSKMLGLANSMKGIDTSYIDAAQLPQAGYVVKSEWFGAVYDDVFQVMKENFQNGRDLFYGMANFNYWCNNSDMTKYCQDGELYAYCNYRDQYGEFLGSTEEASTESSEESS